jgi:NAD(P)H dehydrogenase (quinone)
MNAILMKPKILVTSAAGKTGFAAAMQLLEKQYPVRAFVHRQSKRAGTLKKAGAEIFIGDMSDIRDVRKALASIQRAYLCAPFAPNLLHTSMVFAIAATEAKLEVVTKMTQWFSQPSHPSVVTREHWLADQVIPWMPNVDVITINPGLFADYYFLVLAPIAQLGIMPMPLGEGLNAPPSNEDIARVVVGTLIDPAPHIGKSYRPTGPKLLSPYDTADIFSKVLGRKVKYLNVPHKMFLKAATAQGYPASEISQVRYYNEEHQRSALAINAPTDAVLKIGGREPEGFETIARRTLAERPEAVSSFSNKMKAFGFFARMLMTPTPNMEKYEQQQNHVLIKNPVYSSNSREWLSKHDIRIEKKLMTCS